MIEALTDDSLSKVGCQIANEEAPHLAEMARFDHGWGKDFAAGIGGEAEAIEKEVMRRVSPRTHPEVVKLAVRDALEPRKPRW